MGKLPYFPFYPNDWSRDLEEHPLEIEGAWISICCKLAWAEPRGVLKRTVEQWAKVLRVDSDNANRILNYIEVNKIGDVVTDGNGEVTVMSRRMVRDEKDRINNALRQKRFREKDKSNAPVTDMSQRSSYSSSSSSSNIKTSPISSPPKKSIKRKLKYKVQLILNDGKKRWEGITEEDKILWKETYTGLNIEQILQEMIVYWDGRPPDERPINWKLTIINRLKWLKNHQAEQNPFPAADTEDPNFFKPHMA